MLTSDSLLSSDSLLASETTASGTNSSSSRLVLPDRTFIVLDKREFFSVKSNELSTREKTRCYENIKSFDIFVHILLSSTDFHLRLMLPVDVNTMILNGFLRFELSYRVIFRLINMVVFGLGCTICYCERIFTIDFWKWGSFRLINMERFVECNVAWDTLFTARDRIVGFFPSDFRHCDRFR